MTADNTPCTVHPFQNDLETPPGSSDRKAENIISPKWGGWGCVRAYVHACVRAHLSATPTRSNTTSIHFWCSGAARASFYLDPFARPAQKRGGAWCGECTVRSRRLAPEGEDVRLQVAYLICNQSPPVDGLPSLMTLDEVETLFHEFGHGLHQMLTRVDEGLVAGFRGVEWDAVELPSQFMENWIYRPEVMEQISGHHQTGESLPEELFQKVLAARTYRSGSAMLRQLLFSTLDLDLHSAAASHGQGSGSWDDTT